jgi:hypothetical protein
MKIAPRETPALIMASRDLPLRRGIRVSHTLIFTVTLHIAYDDIGWLEVREEC